METWSQILFLMTLMAEQDPMLGEGDSPLCRSWCLKAQASHHFSTLEQLARLLGEGPEASPEPRANALQVLAESALAGRRRVSKGPVTSWSPCSKPGKKPYMTSAGFQQNDRRTEVSLVGNKRMTESTASEGAEGSLAPASCFLD